MSQGIAITIIRYLSYETAAFFLLRIKMPVLLQTNKFLVNLFKQNIAEIILRHNYAILCQCPLAKDISVFPLLFVQKHPRSFITFSKHKRPMPPGCIESAAIVKNYGIYTFKIERASFCSAYCHTCF